MKYIIWSVNEKDEIFIEDNDRVIINIYYLLKLDSTNLNLKYNYIKEKLINYIINNKYSISINYYDINKDIQQLLKYNINHQKMNEIICEIYYILKLLKNKYKFEYSYTGRNNMKKLDILTHNKPLLIVRIGIIEMRIINFFINNNINIDNTIKKLMNVSEQEVYKWIGQRSWLSIYKDELYLETYIKKLMTNAGFYFDNSKDINYNKNILMKWRDEYLNGIINCDYLYYQDGTIPWLLETYDYIFKKYNKIKESTYLIGHEDFYKIIKNKTELFLTPFAELLKTNYETGKYKKLYKNFEIPDYKLITLNMPLSTYPNKPHHDWLETFNTIENDIDNIISKNKVDIFICSAGCYGIPFCNYVFKKYNITSLYFGNSINIYLGVLLNREKNKPNINKENWVISDLNKRYKNIEKIEDNCYGYN